MAESRNEDKVPVTVVLNKGTVQRVDELADEENRSRAGQVKQLLNEALDARKEK